MECSLIVWETGFNPRSSHTKDSKMVLDAALLNTQHYKVRIKGKVEQSREYFPAVLSKQTLYSTQVMMFLFLLAAEIKDLPIERIYSQTDLDKKTVLFVSERHFG